MRIRLARLVAAGVLLAAVGGVPLRAGANAGIVHILRGTGDFSSTMGPASLSLAASNQLTPGAGVLVGTIGGAPTVIVLNCISVVWAPPIHEVRASGLQVDTNMPVYFSVDDNGLTDQAQLMASATVSFPPSPCGAPTTLMLVPVGPGDFQALP